MYLLRVFRPFNRKNEFYLPVSSDTLTCTFYYREKNKEWQNVRYSFYVDTTHLKRVRILLRFYKNDDSLEYLRDFQIHKIYKTNNLSLEHKNFKVGDKPEFLLINHSDTSYNAANILRHFYGSLRWQTDSGWTHHSGSICLNTNHGNPLKPKDTTFSYIPCYFVSEEYHFFFTETNKYHYTVLTSLEKYNNFGILSSLVEKGITRKITCTFYEVEKVFEVTD